MLSKSCAIIMFGIQLRSTIRCHSEWIGIRRGPWIFDRILFLNIYTFHHVLLQSHFIVMLCLFSSKGWQLTWVQHTRRLTHMRNMKYYFYTSYHHAAHEVWVIRSTWHIAHVQYMQADSGAAHCMSHAESLDKNWRTHMFSTCEYML